jgi:sodium transport system permease protein
VTDLFRDVKTIIISVAVPLILFPLSFGLLETIGVGQSDRAINLSVVGAPQALAGFFEHRVEGSVTAGSWEAARESLGAGRLDAILLVEQNAVTIVYDSRRTASASAAERVQGLFEGYLDAQERALVPEGTELRRLTDAELVISDTGPGGGVSMMALLLPFLLVVASAVSAMPSAADLAAGEKERKTLAPLLAAGAKRSHLVTGKLLAVTLLGVVGTAAFIAGVALSQYVAPGLFVGNAPELSADSGVAGLLLLAFLLSVFFASVELLVSLFADSPKEAQTYLLPILIVALGAGYVASTLDPLLMPDYIVHIPVVNLAAMVKLLVLGLASDIDLITVILWTLFYTTLTTTAGLLRMTSERVML